MTAAAPFIDRQSGVQHKAPMPVALTILLLAAAQGPAAPAAATPATPPVRHAQEGCAFSPESVEKGEIVVCAQRPQSYRLDPDVMAAKKAKRDGGPPPGPERFVNQDCKTIGPMGCRGQAGINLLAAGITLAKMADRLSKGQEIGSMFITDPHPSEYQLYQAAKAAREAREEEARVQEAVKAQAAATASQTAPAATQPK
jgi:hypothetical protein